MAQSTSKNLRSLVMYSVYVRNHSPEGTFAAVQRDLDRIRALGADILWLLPIHPVGEKARKGALGSPYAIRDYRAVNPEFGTLEDLKSLVVAARARGMKCIIDVVYNHTSPDSWLAQHHPEWFYHRPDGGFGNRIGEWSDIIDLDYGQPGLWDYQIETLCYWAGLVDGFRCDVAPLIPLEFWLQARREVAKVNPDCFWLSESVESSFTLDNRERGMTSLSDSEVFQAFDVCYDYDIFHDFRAWLRGEGTLAAYVAGINAQEYTYPDNYVKLRYLENHDQARARAIIPDERALANWTAFIYFQKGMTLLYAGQERGNTNRPSLFDKDTVDWDTGFDLSPLMAKLYAVKKDPIFTYSRYAVQLLPGDVLLATHGAGTRQLAGVFSATGRAATVQTGLPDGTYRDLLGGSEVAVEGGRLRHGGAPLLFETPRKVTV